MPIVLVRLRLAAVALVVLLSLPACRAALLPGDDLDPLLVGVWQLRSAATITADGVRIPGVTGISTITFSSKGSFRAVTDTPDVHVVKDGWYRVQDVGRMEMNFLDMNGEGGSTFIATYQLQDRFLTTMIELENGEREESVWERT